MQVGQARITFCNYFLSSDSFPLPFLTLIWTRQEAEVAGYGYDFVAHWSNNASKTCVSNQRSRYVQASFRPQSTPNIEAMADKALRSLKPCFCDNFAPALASRHFWATWWNFVKMSVIWMPRVLGPVMAWTSLSNGSESGLHSHYFFRALKPDEFNCYDCVLRSDEHPFTPLSVKSSMSTVDGGADNTSSMLQPNLRLVWECKCGQICFEFPIVGICSWRSVEPSPRDPCPSCSARCAITELSPMKANCCCKFFGIEDSALWRSA